MVRNGVYVDRVPCASVLMASMMVQTNVALDLFHVLPHHSTRFNFLWSNCLCGSGIWRKIRLSPGGAWRGMALPTVVGNTAPSMLVRKRLGRTARFTRYLCASSKTYDVGIQPSLRTLHVLQLFGCLPDKFPHMVNGIGPDTCLWVFVKGVPGKIFGSFAATPPLA